MGVLLLGGRAHIELVGSSSRGLSDRAAFRMPVDTAYPGVSRIRCAQISARAEMWARTPSLCIPRKEAPGVLYEEPAEKD